MNPAVRTTVAWAVLAALGSALGHAYLETLEPGVDGVVAGAPSALTLRFTMAIEGRFSTFEVHRLETPDDALPVDVGAPTERERQRLDALAAQLATRVLANDATVDEAGRVDTGTLTLQDGGTAVSLELRDDLGGGIYVVVYDVLAIDTHWTRGHALLIVADATD